MALSSGQGSLAELLKASEGSLDLSSRSLKSEDVTLLARFVASTETLTALNLYNVKISAEESVVLAKALEFNSTLRALSFEHNPIGEVGVAALAEAIRFNASIRALSVSCTSLNPRGGALLANALILNRTLTALNMDGNRIGGEGARHMAEALKVNSTLRTLVLDSNGIDSGAAMALADALATNSSLTRLSLRHNEVTESGAVALGDALTRNSALVKLTMWHEDLPIQVLRGDRDSEPTAGTAPVAAPLGAAATATGAAAAAATAAAASASPNSPTSSLQSVDLTGRLLDPNLDYPIVMPLLARNPRLARLCLCRAGLCGIGADGRGRRGLAGATALARALRFAPGRLAALDLSANFLDDAALLVLAEALGGSRALTVLNLEKNDARVAGVTALCQALRPSLTELNLSQNPRLGAAGGEAVGRLLGDPARGGGLKLLNLASCGLGPEGIAALAAGLPGNSSLEVLNVRGNAPGVAGKMALGLALLGAPASRLKGFYCDEWGIVPGQRALDLSFDPRRSNRQPQQQTQTQQPQQPAIEGEADACLLAGAVFPNKWLLSVTLDGCPLGPGHLKHLAQALKENGSVGMVSLQRCGMGAESARILLELLADKPGLEVRCEAGNSVGEDKARRLKEAEAYRQTLLTEAVSATRMKLHLLGHPGVGKSTLRRALGRGYWTSIWQGSEEHADDLKLEDISQRTRGVHVEDLVLGERTFSLWDYGGLGAFRHLHGLNLLSSPNSMFIIVVSLTSPRAEQKRQIKYWLRLIQSCMHSVGTVIALVGSRADQMGAVGGDYLTKLWDSVRDELTREELRGGIDATLPMFQMSFALDCRKSQEPAIQALRDAATATQQAFEAGAHLLCPALYKEVRRKALIWRGEGIAALPWAGFWQRIQRELYPRASEGVCVTVARVLHHTGELMYADRATGHSWLFFSPSFLLEDVLGSIYASLQLPGGANSASGGPTAAAEAGSGAGSSGGSLTELSGHGSGGGASGGDQAKAALSLAQIHRALKGKLPRELSVTTLAVILADVGVCAEMLPPPIDALGDGSSGGGGGSSGARARKRSGSGTAGDSAAMAAAAGVAVIAEEDRRFVFPSLLTPAPVPGEGAEPPGRGPVSLADAFAGEAQPPAAFAGRRLQCRSPSLVPGLFQRLQAALVARFGGGTKLWHRQALARQNDPAAPVRKNSSVALAAGAVVFAECVEGEEAGSSFMDVVAGAADVAAALAAVAAARAVFEPVLYKFPAMRIEELILAPAALRRLPSSEDRPSVPFADVAAAARAAAAAASSAAVAAGETDAVNVRFPDDPTAVALAELLTPEEIVQARGGRRTGRAGAADPMAVPGARAAAAGAGGGLEEAADANRGSPRTANPFNPFAPPPQPRQNSSAAERRPSANPFAAAPAAAPVAAGNRSANASPTKGTGRSPFNPFAAPAPPPPAAAPAAEGTEAKSEQPRRPPANRNGEGRAAAAVAGGQKRQPGGERGGLEAMPPPPAPPTPPPVPSPASPEQAAAAVASGSVHADAGAAEAAMAAEGAAAEEEEAAAAAAATTAAPAFVNQGEREGEAARAGAAAALDAARPPQEADEDKKIGRESEAALSLEGQAPEEQEQEEDEGDGSAERPYRCGVGGSHRFDETVFRDARAFFGAHLEGRTYKFDEQRVEICLHGPGALALVRLQLVDEKEKQRQAKRGPATTPAAAAAAAAASGDSTGLPMPPDAAAAAAAAGPEIWELECAAVQEVLDERTVAGFSKLGSSDAFPIRGAVIAAVNRRPWEHTAPGPVMPYDQVVAAIGAGEYPLFLQLCRAPLPPAAATAEQRPPPMKLLYTLVVSNREARKDDGEFQLAAALPASRPEPDWFVATCAVPATLPELGAGMFVNIDSFTICGMCWLGKERALQLLSEHPASELFVSVHGFNTPQPYATRVAAVFQRSFHKPLGLVLTWPSDPPAEGRGSWLIAQVMSAYERRYTYCEHNMHASIFPFLQAALDAGHAASQPRGGGSGRSQKPKTLLWKAHSMGCYLLLNVIDRLAWKGENVAALFRRVILDAPDVPTWFFRSVVSGATERGVKFCHYFNAHDKATEISRDRRAIDKPYPGNEPVMTHRNLELVCCDSAKSSTGLNHDYGRCDGYSLLDQREFLNGEPADARLLQKYRSPSGIEGWLLKTK